MPKWVQKGGVQADGCDDVHSNDQKIEKAGRKARKKATVEEPTTTGKQQQANSEESGMNNSGKPSTGSERRGEAENAPGAQADGCDVAHNSDQNIEKACRKAGKKATVTAPTTTGKQQQANPEESGVISARKASTGSKGRSKAKYGSGAQSVEYPVASAEKSWKGSATSRKKGVFEAMATGGKQPQAISEVSGGKSACKASRAAKGRGKAKYVQAQFTGSDQKPQHKEANMLTVEEFEGRLFTQHVTAIATAAKLVVSRPTKKAIDAQGKYCIVRKHSSMGCAVISMSSDYIGEIVMEHIKQNFPAGARMEINGVRATVKRHKNQETGQDVVTDFFVAWGHNVEKNGPLLAEDIVEAFDKMCEQAHQTMNMACMLDPAWYNGSVLEFPTKAKIVEGEEMGTLPPLWPLDSVFTSGATLKPKAFQIINPATGEALKILEVAGFEACRESAPYQIVNPSTGEIVS